MIQRNDKHKFHVSLIAVFLTLAVFYVSAEQAKGLDKNVILSFENAIKTAQNNDPWLTGNVHKQRAIEAMSRAVKTRPDPKVSIGFANLPVNGFDFGQEGMTQAKVGISQVFPRGDTLVLKSQQLQTQSEAFPFQRKNRKSQVAVTVGSLWLDIYKVQQSIALIEKNRSLFIQLVDVAKVSYSSALGKTRQQDIIRAQLELTRLEDRLSLLAQQQSRYEGILSQWLSHYSPDKNSRKKSIKVTDFSLETLVLSQQLPEVELLNNDLVNKRSWSKPMVLVEYFSNHPAVLALEKQINATKGGINLAQQKYQPEWGVNASYGYRADDAMGNSRADLFSVGITFDVPLFTGNRQDQELQSAISETEAAKTDKVLLLRQLLGAYSSAKGRLLRLKERQNLYTTRLLPQIHDQAEASLSAYTNDDGDFSEVVRSRIAVLNSEIDALTLNVEEQKIRLELNYLFSGSLDTANTSSKINVNNSMRTAVSSGNK